MSFRTRLLVIFTLAIVATVGLVELLVLGTTRQAFEREESQRAGALTTQFRGEFERRRSEILRTVNAIAASDAVRSIAIQSDYTEFFDYAAPLAATHSLDLLELVSGESAIISSAEYPARFGYKEDWLTAGGDWNARGAFLRREELPQEVTLALVAVGTATAGDRKLYIVGGRQLDREFLSTLVLPAGMRVLLYRNLDPRFIAAQLIDAAGPAANPAILQPLIEEVKQERRELARTLGSGAEAETFHALPLPGLDGEVLGVLLIASSRRDLVELENSLVGTGASVAALGILVGILLSWWAAARVTRPVRLLAESAARVARGEWNTTVDLSSLNESSLHKSGGDLHGKDLNGKDEIGQLARAFNRMTGELVAQRERLVQAERVAAWRELARRLAHELKNPLFPLQITVENMQRARASYPEQFDEVFREGTTTLLAELAQLKQIVGRFSDFARMPAPEIQSVDINALVAETLKLFEAQLAEAGIQSAVRLDGSAPRVPADPEQITRVLRNLLLNAIDAMPDGGTLTLRTLALADGGLRLEISDTGQGLTPEECGRLFTPYYTTKTHGTGLGLAIVQSVVSDHGGRISVESEKGSGTTFRIELYGTPINS